MEHRQANLLNAMKIYEKSIHVLYATSSYLLTIGIMYPDSIILLVHQTVPCRRSLGFGPLVELGRLKCFYFVVKDKQILCFAAQHNNEHFKEGHCLGRNVWAS